MRFVFNDMILADSDVIEIPAGTLVVVPSSMALDKEMQDFSSQADEDLIQEFPDYLLVCAGQSLKRESYPGWNSVYEGGFYDFTLPNLVNKFIVGFNADGEAILGTGCVYYKDVPEKEAPMPRDVRQMA